MGERDVFRFQYSLCNTAKDDEAEIMIYSDITSWKWSKDDPAMTAIDFDKLLKEAKARGAKKLRLRINSPGGHVDQAVAMRTMLQNSDFDEINVDIEGMCASAATFFVCVNRAHVRIADGSEFMIHNPWAGCIGTASDFIREGERLRKMEEGMHKRYAARTGQSEEKIKSWMDAETWFSAEEAVANGFADELMSIPAVAACASADALNLMNRIYNAVPAALKAKQEEKSVSNAAPSVASGAASENKTHTKEENNQMEIKDITMDQLRGENPELFQQIRQQGVTEERERMQQIDALTDEGFEEMAQEAKASGTSAADFLKNVVTARAAKKKNFIENRKQETEGCAAVAGGTSADNDHANDSADVEKYAREAAEIAKQCGHSGANMY